MALLHHRPQFLVTTSAQTGMRLHATKAEQQHSLMLTAMHSCFVMHLS